MIEATPMAERNPDTAHRTIFEAARVFNGESDLLTAPLTVIVEGERIRSIGQPAMVDLPGQRINCAGRTLMPGLIDAHVHVYAESARLGPPEPPITYRAQYANQFLHHVLMCGFTTVRDVAGGDHGLAMALRDGFLTGPRFFYGGLCLTQTGGHGDLRPLHQATDYCDCGAERNMLAILADGVDACTRAAREELRKGASHIKIMASGGVLSPTDPLDRSQYSEAEIRAIVDECARRGAYVAAHCHPAEAIKRCVQFGVRSIEHGTLIDRPTADYIAARGAFVVPTLSALGALKAEGEKGALPAEAYTKLCQIHDRALASLPIMRAAGVQMGFGTDLLGERRADRGQEFALRAQCLSNAEILRSATSINAAILQRAGELGTISAGAFADLLIVDGDPLNDVTILANTERLTHIMVGGSFVKQPDESRPLPSRFRQGLEKP